jgi:tetratricopeptide (TPR) repeat protein
MRWISIAMVFCACTHAGRDVAKNTECSIGNVWHEYRSKHFVVYTDVSRDRAASTIRDLETLYSLELQGLFGGVVDIPGRARVLAMRDPLQFTAFAGSRHVGGYLMHPGLGEPILVEPILVFPIVAVGDVETTEVVAHELAHYWSWFVFPRQRPWFSEGLATWVQTVANEADPGRGNRAFGLATTRLTEALRESWVPIKDLLEFRRSLRKGMPAGFEACSWLLYHWLWNNRSKQLTDYQRQLSNGEDPDAAWRAAFPEFDPATPHALAKLENELERHRRFGRYAYYSVTAEADPTFVEVPLSSADAHLLLLDARMHWPEKGDSLRRAELDEALHEDPLNPRAIYLRSRLDHSSPLAALRQAVAARPADSSAWLMLGYAAEGKSQEEKEAFRKATELNPDSPTAQMHLARVLAKEGRPTEALPHANRAADLAPASPSVLGILANIASDLGKCKEAVVLQRRAADLIPLEDANRDRFHKKLVEYEARCGQAASPARGDLELQSRREKVVVSHQHSPPLGSFLSRAFTPLS